jgi:spermidine synthase
MAAGGITIVVPVVSKPLLESAWALTPAAGLLAASLVGTFALFALPMMLLGCVCPFAVKLSIRDLGRTGRTSGSIYAVSAIGSVVGTFLPALFMIDRWGVRHSIMAFGLLLIVAGGVILWRLRALPAAMPGLLFFLPLPPMLSAPSVIAREESSYNYLQVAQVGDTRVLVVDWGAFSYYTPGEFRTHQYFDYLLLAPFLRSAHPAEWLDQVLVIGLGSGTVSKQITQAFGPLHIDEVEIDPEIVRLGRAYFDMSEPNLDIHISDGRAFLGRSEGACEWIVVDAYQGSDIPFHLVTEEFFQQLRVALGPEGVLSVNIAWWRPEDPELLRRVVATAEAVFPTVYVVTGISDKSGAVLLAGGEDASRPHLLPGAESFGHDELLEIAREVFSDGFPELAEIPGLGEPFTDDRAPVDRIADRLYRRCRRAAYGAERQVLALDN